MKKLLCLLLALMVMGTVVGCGGEKKETAGAKGGKEELIKYYIDYYENI